MSAPATEHLLQAIAVASAAGSFQEVKSLFHQWSTAKASGVADGGSLLPETGFDDSPILEAALSGAAKNGHDAVVSYLLGQGVKITNPVMDGVLAGKSTGVLQALLDHGWDINSKWWLETTTLW